MHKILLLFTAALYIANAQPPPIGGDFPGDIDDNDGDDPLSGDQILQNLVDIFTEIIQVDEVGFRGGNPPDMSPNDFPPGEPIDGPIGGITSPSGYNASLTLPNTLLNRWFPNGLPASPLDGRIQGTIIIDIVGTGIDTTHDEFSEINGEGNPNNRFLSPILVTTNANFSPIELEIPTNIDLYGHETGMMGCISGKNTGILSYFGTAHQMFYRSAVCYNLPPNGYPAESPVTFGSNCVFALTAILGRHRERLINTPYLRNHGAVLCFPHSVTTADTRFGEIDTFLNKLWQIGVITSISAGNHDQQANRSSPAGAGERIFFTTEEGAFNHTLNWPPEFSGAGYLLNEDVQISPCFSLIPDQPAPRNYHLVSGAHSLAETQTPWFVAPGHGTCWNVQNPSESPIECLKGVDIFTLGENINHPTSRIVPNNGSDPFDINTPESFDREHLYETKSGTSPPLWPLRSYT